MSYPGARFLHVPSSDGEFLDGYGEDVNSSPLVPLAPGHSGPTEASPNRFCRRHVWKVLVSVVTVAIAVRAKRSSASTQWSFGADDRAGARAGDFADHRAQDEVIQAYWSPGMGHRDQKGRWVADTWDHFQIPICDSGPPPGSGHNVQYQATKYVTHWQTKYRSVTFWVGKGQGRHPITRSHPVSVPISVPVFYTATKWVPNLPNAAQAQCGRDKSYAASYHQNLIQKHKEFLQDHKVVRELYIWQGMHECGTVYVHRDFPSGYKKQWVEAAGSKSPAYCQRACTLNPECGGFSWVHKWGCYLKAFDRDRDNQSALPLARKDGVYSGYACQGRIDNYSWPESEEDIHTLPLPVPSEPSEDNATDDNDSLLCLQMILPYSSEVELILMQYQKRLSIFQCDRYAVYSSQQLDLGNGLQTRRVNTSQVAEKGGQWNTALNTPAFLAFWRAVILDGEYLLVSWVVKADPDAVWFPSRLLPVVREYQNATSGQGVYLLNCKHAFEENGHGLHGPLEVLSRRALTAFAATSHKCFLDMQGWGNDQWGEDMWMEQCLMTAKTNRYLADSLLVEKNCGSWHGSESCRGGAVAFHPFKSTDEYTSCLNISLHWAENEKFKQDHICDDLMENQDFSLKFKKNWVDGSGNASAISCQRACTANSECDGFSWVKEWGCWLKTFESANQTTFGATYNPGRYSGYRCKSKTAMASTKSAGTSKHSSTDSSKSSSDASDVSVD